MHVISPSASISKLADLEDSIRGSKLVIGDSSMVDSFVKIKFTGGSGDINIGHHTYINSGCVIYSGNGVRIGSYVLIAANCTLAPTNHEFRARDRRIVEQRFMASRGGIVIGDDVWIGAQVAILDGAEIPDGAIIGACSLVRNEKIEPYGIYGGTPLRQLGSRK